MKALRVLAVFIAAGIALAGLSTCKHDLPVIDIEGYWDLHLSDAGGQPLGFDVFYIQQQGTGLDCSHGLAGSIDGSNVYLEAGVEPAKAVLSGTVAGDAIDGSFTGLPFGSGTFHLVRSTLIYGHLDLDGTCQGVPISIHTDDGALGAGGVPDVGGTNFDLFRDDNTVRVWLGCGFPGATPPVGPYSWPIGLDWEADAGPGRVVITAESGTMTITRFDGTGVAGEFSASFAGGDTISGSFDVSFNVWGWL